MLATTLSRKARFKAALAVAGLTAKEFAAENGVTRTHLNCVLLGDRVSAPLNQKIDELIARSEQELAKSA